MLTYDLRSGGQPKYYRLYTCIREDILRAELLPGQKLPSKRALAGICISAARPSPARMSSWWTKNISRQAAQPCVNAISACRRTRSAGAAAYAACRARTRKSLGLASVFRADPAMRERSSPTAARGCWKKPPHYGCAELRNAIAEYLLRYRGMLAQPDCIIIGSGAEYLYGLIIKLLGRERIYGLEDPGYERSNGLCSQQVRSAIMLPMSPKTVSAPVRCKKLVRILHITPAFHASPPASPSATKRSAYYLTWAAERNAILVKTISTRRFSENKSAATALFHGPARQADLCEHVSHSLAPSMRIGYMVLPGV